MIKKLNYLYRDLVYDNPIEEKATDDLFEYHFDSYIYSPLIIKFYLIYYVWLVTKKHDIPLILKIEDRLNELNQKLNSIRKSCKYF